ncbi:ATP-binding SpoIIE family protein phosphatase [Streptomyces flaveolus]|uniref:ATP-binding SpoIIE family protein phosphatase n=1 Tax=Streptomyces flaveolus TaxID=67297 RepID=UPI00340DABB2
MDAPAHHSSAPTFSLADIATAMLDSRGTVRGWSTAAAELLDLTAAEVCGKPVGDLLADAPVPSCRTRTAQRGKPTAGRTLARHRSGRTIEVAFRVVPLEGCHESLVVVAPLLQATHWEYGSSLLQALLTQDRIGIGIHDLDLRVVRTNITPGMFGGPALPVGGRLADVMSPQDAADAESALREVLATGVPLIGHEQRMRSPQVPGRSLYFHMSAVRLEDADGRPSGVAALVTDATGRWRARRDLELCHRASALIGTSLDVKRTTQDLVDVLVPALGDVAWVELAEAVFDGDEPPKVIGGGELHLRRAAVASADGHWPAVLLQPDAAVPPFPDLPVMRALQQGKVFTLSDPAKVSRVGTPELARLFVPKDAQSVAAAPLFARGLMLGSVALWRTGQREPFNQEDAELLGEITSRAALSVDNARRYTREHRAAVALQQSLLPRAVTDAPAAETAGIYLPAAGGAEIRGDWFDVIPLPSLRVAFVVGDVIGQGLRATATMGRLRTAVQTLADLELEPDELLTHVDDLVLRLAAEASPAHQDAVGATCVYAVYDPVTCRCTMASAGHPPPLVLQPDGTVQRLDLSPGPPLGVGGMPFEITTLDLDPDSILALYTDGLTHRHHPDPDVGIDRLTDRLTALSGRQHSLDAVGRALLADADAPPPRDDITLLLARTRALPEDATVAWEFPADPAIVTRARAAVTDQLAAWGLDEAAFATELIVSELVTNAIRYAGGSVGLRLIHDTTLICEVTDPSNTQPRLRRARTTDEGGRGLFLVAQLSSRWGSRYGRSGKTVWAEQSLGAPDSVIAVRT